MQFKKKWFSFFKKYPIKWGVTIILLVVYFFSLPKVLFDEPISTVIDSAEGDLIGAKIADDGQWRFPETDNVPNKFKKCITTYEDAYFYQHIGFNPVSMFHAMNQNRKAGKIIRGGSTLTQQVIRLHRKNKPRTYVEKIIEIILATRLEFRYSKEKILSLYASHAPFGGNIVGLDAASWRYFGQSAHDLSWAESATLAVLPNTPGLIHVNKNRTKLLKKRNVLLGKLYQKKVIDKTTYELAIIEPLPEETYALPQITPHLLSKVMQKHKGKRLQTSIKLDLQSNVNEIVKHHYLNLKQNHVYNAAVIIVEVKNRKILAYVGNTPTDEAHQKDVDIVDKPRSTGSILKPFLYAAALNAGKILPNTLITDIPTQIGNYRPENFSLNYQGAVPASNALARSLNIPFVNILQDYGLDKFYHDIGKLQLKDINKGTEHYGLSLILGGAESNLWDLCRAYSYMASTINHYEETQGKYFENELTELSFVSQANPNFGKKTNVYPIFDAGSLYATFQTLLQVNRPEGEENWEFFDQSMQIAWKTGTSFGFRDAWAIGVTPQYVVGVWIGNADGEGRPELTGLNTAAPLLFDVFKLLPQSKWFAPPYDELVKQPICRNTGHRAGENCESIDSVFIPRMGVKTPLCPYHQLIHLDATETYQVNTSCEAPENIVHKSWFVLPPAQAYYFKMNYPFYKPLPPFRQDCVANNEHSMDFIYPFVDEQIFLPKDFDEQTSKLIFKAKHALPNIKIYWYLDDFYLTTTSHIHEYAVQPKKGRHTITIVDEFGNEKQRSFKIL